MKSPSNPNPRGTALKEIGLRLDRLTVGRVHRRVVWSIGLGLFFDIYEIFLSGAIGVALKSEYALGGNTLKMLMASAFLGMFIGAALLSRLADVVGRKQAFLLTLTWFSAWSLIGAFSSGPYLLVASRFLAGIGIGAEYPVADAYLSEVLPRPHLGRLAAWTYTCSFLAVPVVGFLALALTGRHVLGIAGWRILLALGCLGAALVTMMRRSLPESPRWLASVGRTSEAQQALAQFESTSVMSIAAAGRKHERPADQSRAPKRRLTSATTPWARLSAPPYRSRFAMMVVFHLLQPLGYYGFGTLAALVLVARGFDVTSSLLYTALSFIGYPVGSALAVPLMQRFDRKFLLMSSVALMAVAGLLFATVDNVVLIVVCGFSTTAISNVFSNIYHVYQAEIFPTEVRASAVGLTYSLSRLSGGALPFVLLPILYAYGAPAMFTVVVIALAIVIAAVGLAGPRTTLRSLDEINPN
jgi:putative MFS transporter